MKAGPPAATAAWLPLAAFGSAVLLHVDRAPPWSLAVACIGLIMQLAHQRGFLALPGAVWRAAIAIALLIATFASYRSISGLAAGSTLLLVMGAAKLLEIRQARDARVMVLVALALLMAAVLDRQSLPRVPLYAASAWLSLAALAALGADRNASSPRRAMGTAGRALLYALPLAALCFVFVPRLPGALWSLPQDGGATTGLGDEMSPGSISALSSSDDIAFRVRFEGAAPPLSQRYWRGPVLHDFDGQTWRRARGVAIRQPWQPESAPVRYRILQEPTGRRYLFGLDTIAELGGRRSYQLFDGQVLSALPVTSTIAYEGRSYLQVRTTGALSATGRSLDTRLPQGRNPRTLALARGLRAAARDDEDYAMRALRYFRESGLQYTLTPPLLGTDSVDDLLFRTRLGFCGHFASAYVTMMRAAGVPARVVTGYLGGTWNELGGFYAVRQSDAHAWAEIWLDGRGWVRIDPTTAVAPERLERTLEDLLDERASATDRLFMHAPWLRSLRDSMDAATNWWQERIVNYNLSVQMSLLRHLGIGEVDYRQLALILLAGVALWGLWVARSLRRPAGPAPDPLSGLWKAYVVLLARHGLTVASHDAPRAVALRAARSCPAASTEISDFSEEYLRLRFGPVDGVPSPAQLRALRRQLKALARATAAAPRARTA